MARDDGQAGAVASSRRSRMTRQLNDDGIWATMGFLGQHWENTGPCRLFGRLKVWATLVRDDGQTVASASNRRFRMTRQLNDDVIWATMGALAQFWEITGPFRLFGCLKAWATLVRDDCQTVVVASSRRSRMTRQLNDDGIWATMGALAQFWEITGPFRLFCRLKAWATLVRDDGQTVASAPNRRSRMTTQLNDDFIWATMGALAQFWEITGPFRLFGCLKVWATMACDDGQAAAVASSRRPRQTRQLNDDGIWATMGFLGQHWEITGPFRLFWRLKVWATMVRDDGQAVALASSRRSRMTMRLNDDGFWATMGFLGKHWENTGPCRLFCRPKVWATMVRDDGQAVVAASS